MNKTILFWKHKNEMRKAIIWHKRGSIRVYDRHDKCLYHRTGVDEKEIKEIINKLTVENKLEYNIFTGGMRNKEKRF